ncbi:MAG: oligosaccharide flippase family protein [Thermoleptolyngbya sp. C42_A2020_037]|nr:oligosaccharide flippase family protein [Thermoleptolyngbya sp. C42_A2020_037]
MATFVLSASISRFLGADELGRYLLAFSFYYIFVGIASHGLKNLMIRMIAQGAESTRNESFYLLNCTILQLVISILGYICLLAIVTILPYEPETKLACYIIGAAVIPFSLSNMTEAFFQSQERMHLIATANVPVYISRIFAMIAAMQQGYGISTIALLFVISETLIFLIQWVLLTREMQLEWKLDPSFMVEKFKSAAGFFAIDSLGIVNARLEFLILSLAGNELLVGLYGGIIQLMQPFLIMTDSLMQAAYPSMVKSVQEGAGRQRKIAQSMIGILLSIALPICIGFFFFGGDLLQFVYGDERFRDAAAVLTAYSLSKVLASFNRPFGFVLMANGLERTNVREGFVTMAIKALSGFFLVPMYQLAGAVSVTLLVGISTFLQFLFAIRRLFSINFLEVLYYPALTCALMLPIFVGLQRLDPGFMIVLAISTLTYLFIVGLLAVYAMGGPRYVWSKVADRNSN